MQEVSVSVCKTSQKQLNTNVLRVWLTLSDFERTENNEIKQIENKYGGKYIKAIFKITNGFEEFKNTNSNDWVSHLIPVSGECSSYGRKIIRDMMEASGYAKVGDFQSYSIADYEDLINLSFPAYINNGRIGQVVNPYASLSELEVSYGV